MKRAPDMFEYSTGLGAFRPPEPSAPRSACSQLFGSRSDHVTRLQRHDRRVLSDRLSLDHQRLVEERQRLQRRAGRGAFPDRGCRCRQGTATLVKLRERDRVGRAGFQMPPRVRLVQAARSGGGWSKLSRSLSAAFCLFALIACGIDPEPSILVAPAQANSALIFVDGSAGVEILAHSLAPGSPIVRPTAIEDVSRVFVAFYSLSLAELGLSPGRVVPSDEFSARQIPPPNAGARRSIVSAGALGTWDTIDTLPPEILALKLPPLDAVACVSSGGCFLGELRTFCKLPCTSTVTPDAPAPPQLPLPPVFEPCPSGWTNCLPPALGSTAACPAGEARFDLDCQPLGDRCSSRFPADVPETACFVDPEAGLDVACGTRAAPGRSLSRAVASGAAVVAIARGVVRESVSLSAPVRIAGACAAESVLSGDVTVAGQNVVLERLNISGIFRLNSGGSAIARNIFLDRGGDIAGSLRAINLAVRGLAPLGLSVRGEAVVDGLSVDTSTGSGLYLSGSGELTLTRASLRAAGGNAIAVEDAAVLRAESIVVEGTPVGAALVTSGTSSVTVDHLVIDRCFRAINTFGASKVVARKVRVTNSENFALTAGGDSQLTVEDVLVRDQVPNSTFGGGAFLLVERAIGYLSRAAIERASSSAMRVQSGTRAFITDADISDTTIETLTGEGLYILGGEVAMYRFRARNVFANGISVSEGELSGSDFTIQGVRREPAFDNSGSGFVVTNASVRVSRIEITDTDLDGIRISRAAPYLEDLTVRNTAHAIKIFDEGDLTAARIAAESARVKAISVETNSRFDATDVRLGPPAGQAVPPPNSRIVGFNVDRMSRATVRELSITSFPIGMEVNAGTARLSRGRISNNGVGVRCLSSGDELPHLDRIVLADNMTNVACGP